jgi:hypothetical protein
MRHSANPDLRSLCCGSRRDFETAASIAAEVCRSGMLPAQTLLDKFASDRIRRT